jgi:hypothetical protein
MNETRHIEIPERLRVMITLAHMLERLERSSGSVGPDQYRSVVRHLSDELVRCEGDALLDTVLSVFPATAELYENLRYESAGLCRAALEVSLNTELSARAAIDRAARRSAR